MPLTHFAMAEIAVKAPLFPKNYIFWVDEITNLGENLIC